MVYGDGEDVLTCLVWWGEESVWCMGMERMTNLFGMVG